MKTIIERGLKRWNKEERKRRDKALKEIDRENRALKNGTYSKKATLKDLPIK